MVERKKWKTICNGKVEEGVVLPEPVRQSHKLMIEGMLKHMNEPVDPPKDLCEFETRLFKVLESGLETIFGHQHYLSDQKYIKREPSIENLIHVTKELEKKAINGIKIINMPILEGYKFLKLALENDYPFSVRTQHYLGIFVDLSGISKSAIRTIGVQAAGQIFWHYLGKDIRWISKMVKIICENSAVSNFLDLQHMNMKIGEPNTRVICNWLGKIYPVPENLRKTKSLTDQDLELHFSKLIMIPGILARDLKRINFPKLRIAVMTSAKIMSLLGKTNEEIAHSQVILQYKNLLRFYCREFIGDWINEAVATNGNIFIL